MINASIIIVTLFILQFWFEYAYEFKLTRKLKFRFNYKPFTCVYCLSTWTALIISLITLDVNYLIIPLIAKQLIND